MAHFVLERCKLALQASLGRLDGRHNLSKLVRRYSAASAALSCSDGGACSCSFGHRDFLRVGDKEDTQRTGL